MLVSLHFLTALALSTPLWGGGAELSELKQHILAPPSRPRRCNYSSWSMLMRGDMGGSFFQSVVSLFQQKGR